MSDYFELIQDDILKTKATVCSVDDRGVIGTEQEGAIRAAYRGELKKAVLLEPNDKWRHVWNEPIWLVPDKATADRIKKTSRQRLVLTPDNFFHVCEMMHGGERDAKGALEAIRLFAGDVSRMDAPTNDDMGKDIDEKGSPLWVSLFSLLAKESDLLARLQYIRGTGCRLVEDERTGFRLVPIIDASGCNGWESQAAFDSEKWCLNPYLAKLTAALKQLRANKQKGVC